MTSLDGDGKKPLRVLYIQMEYCSSKTLKTVIDDYAGNVLNDESRQKLLWRLFRQCLEALDFVHSHRTMHRDVKPANIFLDQKGNVKLGDFGLAVRPGKLKDPALMSPERTKLEPLFLQRTTSYTSANKDLMRSAPVGALDSLELTGEVGTVNYTSPEQESGGNYHMSADMYALGIVLFEMWYPFDTAMERAIVLDELRRTGVVPSSSKWPADNELLGKVKGLIEQLVSHDPSARPTANQLLKHPDVPVILEDAYIQSALQAVRDRAGLFRTTLLEQLFSQLAEEHEDYTFDYRSLSLLKPDEVQEGDMIQTSTVEMLLLDFLKSVFRNHAATQVSSPLFIPSTNKIQLGYPDVRSAKSVVVMDDTGTLLQLPSNLTLPFARYIARTGINTLRRYDFSTVFEQNPMRGKPHESTHATFDLVWLRSTDQRTGLRDTLLRGEVLCVVDDVASRLDGIIGSSYIRLNDTELLDIILDICILQCKTRDPARFADPENDTDTSSDEDIQHARNASVHGGSRAHKMKLSLISALSQPPPGEDHRGLRKRIDRHLRYPDCESFNFVLLFFL